MSAEMKLILQWARGNVYELWAAFGYLTGRRYSMDQWEVEYCNNVIHNRIKGVTA